MSDAATIAKALQASLGDDDDERVLARLRGSPHVRDVLEELARHRDLEVRGWVPGAARALLGEAGVPLIKRLTEDGDPDIRGLALDALEAIDPTHLQSLRTNLRRRLRSKDDSEVISVAWRVAQAGDAEAMPAIDAFRQRYDPSWWQHKAAAVILLAMSDPAEVPRRLRAHDHDHMTWLSYAATWIDVPDARPALEYCAENAPDQECRTTCAYSLEHD